MPTAKWWLADELSEEDVYNLLEKLFKECPYWVRAWIASKFISRI